MGTVIARAPTNVYVDGFNLYYRCLKGTAFKWLDLSRLCGQLLPGHEIHRIRYFTAVVQARSPDFKQSTDQHFYLRALSTIPNLTIHYGLFRTRRVRAWLAEPPAAGSRTVEVLRARADRLLSSSSGRPI
jgi:hypothetical protein